jgi:hypothetical protein
MSFKDLLRKCLGFFVHSNFTDRVREQERDRCIRKIIEMEPETFITTGPLPSGKQTTMWRVYALKKALES